MVQSYFSVIMATRNRPADFRKAVDSVLAQSFRDIEIIVVNDGSDDECQAEYSAILNTINGVPVQVVSLVHRPNGHGQSFAINSGVGKSKAPYVCFLDDDDYWTDPRHLQRAADVISSSPVDLYMANQTAYEGRRSSVGADVEDLGPRLERLGRRPEPNGSYTVSVEDLLKSRSFCHLNTLIVRRTLYEDIGGMEETIRWECDHDLYLRLIDRAAMMKFMPVVVSHHNIPDPAKKSSMTTGLAERRLFQLAVFHRAQYLARHPMIRAYAQKHTADTLKRIAESLAGVGRYVWRDISLFGLSTAIRNSGRVLNRRTIIVKIPKFGSILIRKGDSDYDTVVQTLGRQEYLVREPIQNRIYGRYKQILGMGKTPVIIDAGVSAQPLGACCS